MKGMNSETEKLVQEMQILENNLQNILMQKQAFQLELSESQSALSEVEKSKDEVYKIIGQLMLKSEKSKVIDELKNKEKILDIRLNSLQKQEERFSERLEELREKIMGSMK